MKLHSAIFLLVFLVPTVSPMWAWKLKRCGGQKAVG